MWLVRNFYLHFIYIEESMKGYVYVYTNRVAFMFVLCHGAGLTEAYESLLKQQKGFSGYCVCVCVAFAIKFMI